MGLTEQDRATFVGAVVSWLERERVDVLKALSEKGVALTRSVQRVFAERTHTYTEESGEWRLVKTHQTQEETSVLAQMSTRCASWRWVPTTPSPFATSDDVGENVKAFEQRLLGDYLTSLVRVAQPEPELASRLANEYVDYLFATEVTEVEEVQLGGVVPPLSPITSTDGMLSVRALSAEELGTNLRRMFHFDDSLSDQDIPSFPNFVEGAYSALDYVMGCMLTVRRKVPRASALSLDPRLRQVLLAFQLLGYSVFGRGFAPRWTEPGPRPGAAPELIELPDSPEFEERPITGAVLDQVSSMADLVPLTFSKPKDRIGVALHQFGGGCAEASDADAIIAFTISLEALLVPGSSGENSYRFRLNGAKYLGSGEQERQEIYAQLKTLYVLRSKLVHGVAPKEAELGDSRPIGRRLAARGLAKALKEGWPDGTDFETLVLA